MNSDRDIRDQMVRDYMKIARANGSGASSSDIERLVISDLEMTDRCNAEAAQHRPATKKPAEPEKERVNAGDQLAAEKGYQRTSVKDRTVKPGKLSGVALQRYTALFARMKQMCAVVEASKHANLADRGYAFPDLAKSVLSEHADFTFGRRRYRGLNWQDKQRAFWRAIEDIADRSTGVLGPWWVK